jgi:hypothetical protein
MTLFYDDGITVKAGGGHVKWWNLIPGTRPGVGAAMPAST